MEKTWSLKERQSLQSPIRQTCLPDLYVLPQNIKNPFSQRDAEFEIPTVKVKAFWIVASEIFRAVLRHIMIYSFIENRSYPSVEFILMSTEQSG